MATITITSAAATTNTTAAAAFNCVRYLCKEKQEHTKYSLKKIMLLISIWN